MMMMAVMVVLVMVMIRMMLSRLHIEILNFMHSFFCNFSAKTSNILH